MSSGVITERRSDPQSLKARVDSLYHRILKAEVDARLNAETDKRKSLERELQVGPQGTVKPVQQTRPQKSHHVARPRSIPTEEKVKRKSSVKNKQRGNVFDEFLARSRKRTVPVVRQFRHKHEIVRDAENARQQLLKAKERLEIEREKCVSIDDEHAQVAEQVHANKQKIKSLITLIRSLALSSLQKRKDDKHGSEQSPSSDDNDASHIIDDHLSTILDLLPQYERKVMRVRNVVFNNMDGTDNANEHAMPSSIDELLQTVSIPSHTDHGSVLNDHPNQQEIERQYKEYLHQVFAAGGSSEPTASTVVDRQNSSGGAGSRADLMTRHQHGTHTSAHDRSVATNKFANNSSTLPKSDGEDLDFMSALKNLKSGI